MERKVKLEVIIQRGISLVKYLLSRWFTILSVSFLMGVIGVLYAWLSKPIYIAEMTFVAETEGGSRLGGYASIAAQFGFDIGMGSNNMFEGDNLVELLKSKNLIEKTLLSSAKNNKTLLIDDYLRINKINSEWQDNPKYKNVDFNPDISTNTRLEDSILQVATDNIGKNMLEVYKKDKRLSQITAKVSSNDENFSKDFVELLATNAIQYYTDYKSKKGRQNVEILQKQVDSVKGMLAGSITEVAAATDLNVNPVRQSLKTPAQRKQVDVQVNAALYTELLKNLELSKIAMRKETPLIQIIDTPRFPLEKKKPGRLLTGILFAFAGGILAILFVLFQSWYKSTTLVESKSSISAA